MLGDKGERESLKDMGVKDSLFLARQGESSAGVAGDEDHLPFLWDIGQKVEGVVKWHIESALSFLVVYLLICPVSVRGGGHFGGPPSSSSPPTEIKASTNCFILVPKKTVTQSV